MTSYTHRADMILRFGEEEIVRLTDRTNTPPTTIDGDTLIAAMADACDFVDSFLAVRYSLPIYTSIGGPLGIIPPALTRATADIARYYLHGRRVEKDDPVRLAYMEAERWLRAVAKGEARLDIGSDEPEGSGNLAVATNEKSRPLTADTLKGFV